MLNSASNPKISVVMSVWNSDKYIRHAIESILCQTLGDFEFIIIDDSSNDTSREIISSYADKDKRIVFISNPKNLGLAASLNRGIKIARGGYVARFDPDDIAIPTRFQVQYDYLESRREVFCIGTQAVNINENGNELFFTTAPLNEKEIFRILKNGIARTCLIHPSIMFRNNGTVFYNEKFHFSQDRELYGRLMTEGKILRNLPNVLLKYRIHKTANHPDKKIKQFIYRKFITQYISLHQEGNHDNYNGADFSLIDNINAAEISEKADDRDFLQHILRVKFSTGVYKESRAFAVKLIRNRGSNLSTYLLLLASFLPDKTINIVKKIRNLLHQKRLNKKPIAANIGLLMSDGTGLSTWASNGTLHRELMLYENLLRMGWLIHVFSYDSAKTLPPIETAMKLIPVKFHWRLPVLLSQYLLPIRFKRIGRTISTIITNQASAAMPAIAIGKLWKTKLVARGGYVYGQRCQVLQIDDKKSRRRKAGERKLFENADVCFTPTAELADWISKFYKIDPAKIKVVSNYVNTNAFKPMKCDFRYDVISIGRLTNVKRHDLLIRAMAGTGRKILIVGDGEARASLENLAEKHNVRLEILSSAANEELVQCLNNSRVFFLGSKWEGHPKALIEAMSCGLACIGVNSPGICNLIKHSNTGLLVQPDEKQVRKAILSLIEDSSFAERLGDNARRYVLDNFDFSEILAMYQDTLWRLNGI
ncbi:MAG: hypothetical protein A2Y10_12470 [Planctomycetes bacterium GWF2_41_51]|nr:MAG: hypothetical protein A2Y10_12470 [Planctomycetes bacterium GWF2_41_51]HBG27236.1 hypothetical protein [Phycisphaerales bacterium]